MTEAFNKKNMEILELKNLAF